MNEFRIQDSGNWEDHIVENRMKNSHSFKSYVDHSSSMSYLSFWQIITYNLSFCDIIDDFNF